MHTSNAAYTRCRAFASRSHCYCQTISSQKSDFPFKLCCCVFSSLPCYCQLRQTVHNKWRWNSCSLRPSITSTLLERFPDGLETRRKAFAWAFFWQLLLYRRLSICRLKYQPSLWVGSNSPCWYCNSSRQSQKHSIAISHAGLFSRSSQLPCSSMLKQ